MQQFEPIVLTVLGEPKGQPRTRPCRLPGGRVRMYDPGSADGWKHGCSVEARRCLPARPIEGPIEVAIEFRFRRPKAHYRSGARSTELRPDAPKWHVAKPDRDNAEKATLDALTDSGVWRDDSQVCCGQVSKIYADHPMLPGATITIRRPSHV